MWLCDHGAMYEHVIMWVLVLRQHFTDHYSCWDGSLESKHTQDISSWRPTLQLWRSFAWILNTSFNTSDAILEFSSSFLRYVCCQRNSLSQNSHLLYKFTINPTSLQGVGHKDKISFPPGLLRCSRHCLHRFSLPSAGSVLFAFLPVEETVMLTNSSTTIRWKCSQRKSVGGLRGEWQCANCTIQGSDIASSQTLLNVHTYTVPITERR